MLKRITILLAAALVLATPAAAQQLFDFLGQSVVPASVGSTLSMDAVVTEGGGFDTPLPLDFANFDYTIVVSGLVLDSEAGSSQTYSGGTITIYEDAATVADYANPATFSDGTAILSGTFTSLTRTMFTATLGTASGFVDWTGGTRLNDLAPEDQAGWPFLTGISRRSTDIEPGYDEQWDGKVEPSNVIVGTESTSWGELKASHR